MAFDINNLQFVLKDNSRSAIVEPGKTLYVVCCEETMRCLQGLVPYAPDERDFSFFANVFSAPHTFRQFGTVPQISVRPNNLEQFFRLVETNAEELDRPDLQDYFFKCIEVDMRLDIHKETTGTGRFPIIKFIERLQEAKENMLMESLPDLEPPNSNTNPDFTTARQVLAIIYLLEYCKVEGVDQIQKARFIEFLTNKNPKNIYDLVRSPLATKKGNFRREDLQFIRPYFENLGLTEIVKMINNQLDKPDL